MLRRLVMDTLHLWGSLGTTGSDPMQIQRAFAKQKLKIESIWEQFKYVPPHAAWMMIICHGFESRFHFLALKQPQSPTANLAMN